MKKTLVALAVLAASGAAMAQSSVTLFGIFDAGYAVGNGSISNKTQLRNSGYNSSRLGFRGVEDLGGGMKAGFHLEASANNDDGTGAASNSNNQANGSGITALPAGTTASINGGSQGLTFNRRSVVTLSGSMGEVILGRDYTPQFWSETVYDPFGTNGVGTNIAFNKGGTTGVRSSNGIGYKSPSMGGIALWAQTWMGENASTAAKVGDGNGFRITFDQGKFSAAVADSS
jgi:predicted porin